jgi:hypothetical protein
MSVIMTSHLHPSALPMSAGCPQLAMRLISSFCPPSRISEWLSTADEISERDPAHVNGRSS